MGYTEANDDLGGTVLYLMAGIMIMSMAVFIIWDVRRVQKITGKPMVFDKDTITYDEHGGVGSEQV